MTQRRPGHVAAVIADLVGSRGLQDRAGAQEHVISAWAAAHGQVVKDAGAAGSTEPRAVSPWATVGDEFQAVYPDLATALRALLRLQLALEGPVRLRFGIGLGTVTTLEAGEDGPIQDGDAWWSARAAIEAGHDRDPRGAVIEVRRAGASEAGAGDGTADGSADAEPAGGVEAAAVRLLEHALGQLKPRERRIVRGTLEGTYQSAIAEAEGISQSAVSQSLSRSGGRTLVEVDALLAGPRTAGETTEDRS